MKNKPCSCSRSSGLFISNRSISSLVVGGMIVMMGSFSIGYFFGKQFYIDQYAAKIEQESFADHIYTSLCSIYDQSGQSNVLDLEDTESKNAEIEQEKVIVMHPEQDDLSDEVRDFLREDGQAGESGNSLSPIILTEDNVLPERHYAQLIGFGTKKFAEQFVQKMKRKHVDVYIQSRNSKTAKGKKIAWYQVVTEQYADYTRLEDLVDRIAKEEKIKGIKIVRC